MSVRRLAAEDAAALQALRRESLERHPLAFSSSPEEDRFRTREATAAHLAAPDQVVFGAFDGAALVGMLGMRREERRKRRHKAMIWGVYVAPAGRGRGHGHALFAAALAEARRWPGLEKIELSVSSAAPDALALYESVGFRTWGREPRSLCHEGHCADEIYLTLDLGELRG